MQPAQGYRQFTQPGKIIGNRGSSLIEDDFLTDRAPGALNGTDAEPGPGPRVAVDSNNKFSISAGTLTLATGNVANDAIWWNFPLERLLGRAVIFQVTPANGTGAMNLGWDGNTSAPIRDAVGFNVTNLNVISNGGTAFAIGVYASLTEYFVAVILRPSGCLYFIKGGSFANWTLLYTTTISNTSPVLPAWITRNTTAAATSRFVRVPPRQINIPPLASDSFTRADGPLGWTDGAAAPESGGGNKAWLSQAGTWATASNLAQCTALAGGIGITTISNQADLIAEVIPARSAGTAGLIVRYTDSNNYVKAVHNGTNAQLIKIVAGTPTTLVDTAATYTPGSRLALIVQGTKFRLLYNDLAVGAEQTIADAALQTGAAGIFTDDTANTFDNFVLWARADYDHLLNEFIG